MPPRMPFCGDASILMYRSDLAEKADFEMPSDPTWQQVREFAEIAITTSGGLGNASTNFTYLIYKQSPVNFDVGIASSGALFAVIFANIVAIFLMRIVGKNLD